MTKKPITNLSHSVRQRLANEAKRTGRLYNELEQYYSMERFLYRLSQSPHADKFVLKGALLFTAWRVDRFRPTRDIDLLGQLSNAEDVIAQVFRDVCGQKVPDDGLLFDPSSVTTAHITEDADYEGIRVTLKGTLGTSRVSIQIDIGFSDVVVPSPGETDYPTILNFPAPRLKAYSRETVIAKKLQAMVSLGEANSRMKDFADLWFLAHHFEFDGQVLARAISETFLNRRTPLQADPVALTPAFPLIEAKQAQWNAFLRQSSSEDIPASLAAAINLIAVFLLPVLENLTAGKPFTQAWNAPGPWRHRT